MILSDRPTTIEVVEPTLVSEAGHCAALFQGLRAAGPELAYRLWIDRRAQLPGWESASVRLRPTFHRRLRKPEAFFLYRRLLRAGARVLVPTASYFDLRALDLAAGGRLEPLRAFLYFHKLRVSAKRARALAALARRQPALELFGTSEEIVARLREAGFEQVRRVLPVLSAGPVPAAPQPFRHLLSAGAARADKGFAHIVELVAWLAQHGSQLPITVQTSGDHYGRYDDATRANVARLQGIAHAALTLRGDTLDAGQYAALFPGSICLQPYAPEEYGDKMSAVTFDALRAGAPIITTAGTTMAEIVARTGAGLVVTDCSAPALFAAVEQVLAQYAQMQARALAAAPQFQPAASWSPLVERLRLAQ